jgi:hypothetical protein
MAARLRRKEQRQLKAALDDWEGEGGSVAATQCRCRFDRRSGQGAVQSIGNVTMG